MSPRRRSRLVLPPDEYKKLCTKVHQRDSWKCRTPYCGARVISAHHIIYRSADGDDASWNLISLCDRCHKAVHARYLLILPLVKEVVNGNVIYEDIIDADKGVKWMFLAGWHPRPNKSQVP